MTLTTEGKGEQAKAALLFPQIPAPELLQEGATALEGLPPQLTFSENTITNLPKVCLLRIYNPVRRQPGFTTKVRILRGHCMKF